VVKHIEVGIDDLKPVSNLGGIFSKTPKEKSFNRRNSSKIAMLNSYKPLDVVNQDGEIKIFEHQKGAQSL